MVENVEKILNMKKIRYTELDIKLKPYLKNMKKYSTINVYIDLPSTIKQLYNPKIIENLNISLSNKEKYSIASGLLNMIGHYRHYFASRYMMYSNIYFLNNSEEDLFLKEKSNGEYKKDYYTKRIDKDNSIFGNFNRIMYSNYELMNIIIESIPHAYLIDSLNLDYRPVLSYLIEKNNNYNNIMNIILTTDDLLYQEVLNDNTLILEPKGEKTNIITNNNLMENLCSSSKKLLESKDYLKLFPENINIINALISHKDYSIEGIKRYGYAKAIQFLLKNDINTSLEINNINSLKDILNNYLSNEEIDQVCKNLYLTNDKLLMNLYIEKLELILNKAFIDNINPSDIKKINEKYFSRFPLILDYMWEGEE